MSAFARNCFLIGTVLIAARAQETADRGIELAMSGRCAEAMPLLDEDMRNAGYKTEFKRTVSLAGVRCSMLLGQQIDAMSFLSWLQQAYPDDPEILFLSVHVFSDLSVRNSDKLMSAAPNSPLVVQLNAENFERQGDYKKAIAEYRILLQRTPNQPGVHYRIGGLILAGPATPTSAAEARREFEAESRLILRAPARNTIWVSGASGRQASGGHSAFPSCGGVESGIWGCVLWAGAIAARFRQDFRCCGATGDCRETRAG